MSDPVAGSPRSLSRSPGPTNGATSTGPVPDGAERSDDGATGAGSRGAAAVPTAGPALTSPSSPTARPRGRWMTLLLVVVGLGLGLGVLAAVLSAPLRGSGRIVATSLPGAPGGAARAGAGGAGDADSRAEGGAPGGGAAQGQNPGTPGGQAGGAGGAGRAANGAP